MNGAGSVEAIHTASKAKQPMESKNAVRAVAGKGIQGDRYFKQLGTFSEVPRGGLEITFTEAEAIEAIARESDITLEFADHRRNITTRDTALNHLVGRQFRVGDAVCEGIRLCEPCDHLRRLTVEGINEALAHRGGLRAEIVESGTIRVGDALEPL